MECFEDCFLSLLRDEHPEERRRRKFKRKHALAISGAAFVMHAGSEESGHGVAAAAASSVRRFRSLFGGSSKTPSEAVSAGTPLPVWVALSVEDGKCELNFKTLELVHQKPKHSGVFRLGEVKKVNTQGRRLRAFDSSEKLIFDIESDTKADALKWQIALDEAADVYDVEIGESVSQTKSLLHRQRRKLELAARKREREEQKKKLGDVGMRYTAQAMAQKG